MKAILPSVFSIAGVSEGDRLPQYSSIGCYTILYQTRKGNFLCAKCASEHEDEDDAVSHAGSYDEGEPVNCNTCEVEIESSYGPVTVDETTMSPNSTEYEATPATERSA